MPSLMEFQIENMVIRYSHNSHADNRKHKNVMGGKMGFKYNLHYVRQVLTFLCSVVHFVLYKN